jgi:hypothetical protein
MARTRVRGDGHPLWMAQRSIRRRLRGEAFRRIVPERPGEALGVDGVLRDAWCCGKAGAGAPAMQLSRFGEDPPHSIRTSFPSRRRPLDAEPGGEPLPEWIEELPSPAPEAPPALGIDRWPEVVSDLFLRPSIDQMTAESLEDRPAGVPPPRMEKVGEHRDRALTSSTEESADPDDEVHRHRGVPEDLSGVGAVAHDSEELRMLMGWVAAERAGRRTKGIDRRRLYRDAESVMQLLDGARERRYDDHRIFGCAAMRMGKNRRVAAFLFSGFGYQGRILPDRTARERAPHSGRGVDSGGKARPGTGTTGGAIRSLDQRAAEHMGVRESGVSAFIWLQMAAKLGSITAQQTLQKMCNKNKT